MPPPRHARGRSIRKKPTPPSDTPSTTRPRIPSRPLQTMRYLHFPIKSAERAVGAPARSAGGPRGVRGGAGRRRGGRERGTDHGLRATEYGCGCFAVLCTHCTAPTHPPTHLPTIRRRRARRARCTWQRPTATRRAWPRCLLGAQTPTPATPTCASPVGKHPRNNVFVHLRKEFYALGDWSHERRCLVGNEDILSPLPPPSHRKQDSGTPLHGAARKGHAACVRALVSGGAPTSPRDGVRSSFARRLNETTPLLICMSAYQRFPAVDSLIRMRYIYRAEGQHAAPRGFAKGEPGVRRGAAGGRGGHGGDGRGADGYADTEG